MDACTGGAHYLRGHPSAARALIASPKAIYPQPGPPTIRLEGTMSLNVAVGDKFPDLALPDHTGAEVRLSEITRGKDPLAVVFYRGWY